MIIGLFGFSFEDRNKGCEALTYSFIELLSNMISNDLTIVNLSGIGKDDKIKAKWPNIHFETVGFQKDNISFKSFYWLLKCDYIFDCTFGDNFSDIYNFGFVSRTTNYKEMTVLLNKKLILAPQTIGPFKDEKLKKRVGKLLRKCHDVYTRDQLSSDLVRNLSGVNAKTVTDLAFLLPYDSSQYQLSGDCNFGINISGLLWSGGFDKNNQFELKMNYQEYIEKIIEYLEQDTSNKIYLIPHVLSEDPEEIDEDTKICRYLGNKYGIEYAGHFMDPIEVKSFISNMDFFIGSRMHSTIAAFSAGVPTVPVSYSRKFEGLFHGIGYKYGINGKEYSTQDAVQKTIEYISNVDELRKAQKQSLINVEHILDEFKQSLSENIRIQYNMTVGAVK